MASLAAEDLQNQLPQNGRYQITAIGEVSYSGNCRLFLLDTQTGQVWIIMHDGYKKKYSDWEPLPPPPYIN